MASPTRSLVTRMRSIPMEYPFAFGVVFSGFKTSFSDLMVQKVVEQREQIDWKRNAAFAAFGFIYLVSIQPNKQKEKKRKELFLYMGMYELLYNQILTLIFHFSHREASSTPFTCPSFHASSPRPRLLRPNLGDKNSAISEACANVPPKSFSISVSIIR